MLRTLLELLSILHAKYQPNPVCYHHVECCRTTLIEVLSYLALPATAAVINF